MENTRTYKAKRLTHMVGIGTQDLSGIPHPCQYTDLNTTDPTHMRDESMNWLKKLDMKIPIWSRQYPSNCVGYARDLSFTKEKNYNVEIPRRLFSLWGNVDTHGMVIEKMSNLKKYQWVCNVLSCCAAVGYNLNDWNPRLLDDIVYRGCLIFSELCQRYSLSNQDFCMHHMSSLMNFRNTSFRVAIEQKSQGFMFMPYGYGEYNLARALADFFRNYQFGLLECENRCLAFGFATDVEQGYFMYDCQSEGAPLFNENAANAYVLRTDHLQILLYCLTVAMGVTIENVPFKIYNVDVVIEDIREKRARKPLYVPHFSHTVSIDRRANPIHSEPCEQGIHQSMKASDNRFKGVSVNYHPGCDGDKEDNSNSEEVKAYFEDPTSKGQPATDSLLRIGVKGSSGRIAGGHEKVIDLDSPKSVSSDGTLINDQQFSNPLKPPTTELKNKSSNTLLDACDTDNKKNSKNNPKSLNSNVINKFPQYSFISKKISKPNPASMKQQNTLKKYTKPYGSVAKKSVQNGRYLRKIQFMDTNPLLAKLKQNTTKAPDNPMSALKTTKPRETPKVSDKRPITNEKANKPFKIEYPKSQYAQKNLESYIKTGTNVANKLTNDKSNTGQNAEEKKSIQSSPTKNAHRTSKFKSLGNQNPKSYFKTRTDLDLVELYDVTKPNVLGVKVYLVNNRPTTEESSEVNIPHTIHITKTMF